MAKAHNFKYSTQVVLSVSGKNRTIPTLILVHHNERFDYKYEGDIFFKHVLGKLSETSLVDDAAVLFHNKSESDEKFTSLEDLEDSTVSVAWISVAMHDPNLQLDYEFEEFKEISKEQADYLVDNIPLITVVHLH